VYTYLNASFFNEECKSAPAKASITLANHWRSERFYMTLKAQIVKKHDCKFNEKWGVVTRKVINWTRAPIWKKRMMATMQGLPTLRRTNMNGTHINLFQLHCIVINDKQLPSHQCCNRWIRTKHISSFQDEMTYIIWNWCELRRDRKQDNIWAWWLNHFIIVDYIYLNRYVLLIRGVAKITYFLCASSVIGGDQKTHHSSHQ